MRVAIYARVSTSDKEQDPDTQLMPLRDFCTAQGWEVADEYVDHAPANDQSHRFRWRQAWATSSRSALSKIQIPIAVMLT